MTVTAEQLDPKHIIATPEQIEKIAKFLKEGVENIVDGSDDSIHPTLAVYCYDVLKGKHEMRLHLIDMGFNTPMEKKLSMKTIAATIYKSKLFPVAIGLLAEAWVSVAKSEDEIKNRTRRFLMPADDPERKEVAILAVAGFARPDGVPLTYHDIRYMARDKQNNIVWDGEWLNKSEDNGNSMDSSLLDHFFRGYVGFVKGDEDPETYLHGKKVVQIHESNH